MNIITMYARRCARAAAANRSLRLARALVEGNRINLPGRHVHNARKRCKLNGKHL
jgi:hypothetical protein